jgi:hypothetical protein
VGVGDVQALMKDLQNKDRNAMIAKYKIHNKSTDRNSSILCSRPKHIRVVSRLLSKEINEDK